MRWVVGDVHGCARELDDLLRAIRFDRARDRLWAIGDLVNTGPDSLAVLRLWRDVGGRAVLGNHDVYALRAFSGSRPRRHDTLDELFGAPDAAELLERLRAQPVLAQLAAGDEAPPAWLVHAGIHPQWSDLESVALRLAAVPHDDEGLREPWVGFATRVRCCTADGEMSDDPGPPEDCKPPFRPWDDFYRGPTLVVHGHWAMRGAYRGPHAMSLDSGCVYSGSLTAWCHEEDRLVQIPAIR